ncbi:MULTISPECIES: filamentous hemagglutinin N-terminal domain-containing protein, partial [unclassified Variovorax]
MNARLYRIVFNAARGMRIVVQETARSTGKASGATPVLVGTALASLLVAMAAQAQIVGAPGAAPGLRPTVLLAPNGVPLVNIQTPSPAGVSRNLYNQFDVQPQGVILNNSRTDVQTQLGGWVQANPFLATGPARIILNEVVSGNPTQLRGAIEVGGQRAEVIVANPAGIAVDGATFINASRATLTTGAPQLNALGGLEGYVVRGGTVSIDGAGLDARSTDYAAILARAIKVNAALWANELKVVTGANQVSADQGQVSPTAGTGKAPVFALDLAHLGGMYAGKITLIGTEHGVGARNAGTIMAADGSGPLSGPGEFVITADGRLENIGTIQAARRAAIAAESLANSGRITSGGELKIATQGALGNTGGTLEAQSLQLASGSDIDNRGGTMRQTSGVGLTVTAPILSNTAGGVIGAELLPETPAQPGPGTGIDGTGASHPATPSTGIETGTGSGGGSGSGGSATSASPSDMPMPAPGTITAAGSILNDAGRVYVGGPIHLQTPQVDNNGGSLTTTSLTASGPSFRNAGGTVNVAGSFTAHVDRFDNTGGTVRAGSLQIASSGDLVNTDGQLESMGDANIAAAGSLDNTRGSITAARHVAITAASMQGAGVLGAGIQADGKLGSAGDLRVTTTGALAANGTILAAGDATLQGASIDLSSSTTTAANIALTATQGNLITSAARVTTPGTLSVTADAHAGQGWVNDTGRLIAGQLDVRASNIANTHGGQIVQTGSGATRITVAGALINNAGTLASKGNTTVAAASLANQAGSIRAAEASNLDLAVGGLLDNSAAGVIGAGGNAAITAGVLRNDTGRITAVGDLSATIVGAATNIGGTLAANGSTTLTADTLDNTRGSVAAVHGQLRAATAGQTVNAAGKLQAGRAVALANGGLVNTAGYVSGSRVSVDTRGNALANTHGTIAALTAVTVNSGALVNDAGLIHSGGAMTIDVHGAGYDNRGGQTLAAGDLRIDAGAIDNTGALIRSGATTTLNAASIANANTSGADQGIEGDNVAITTVALGNTSGAIRANVNATLTSSGTVDNTSGLISAGDTVAIVDPNAANPAAKTLDVTNTGGAVLADQRLAVDAASLGFDGQLRSGGDMRLALTQDVVTAAASRTIASHDLSVATRGNVTHGGTLAAGNALALSARNIDNTATGDIRGHATTLAASDTVTNRGVIDGVVTRIDAGTLTNIGTGRIYGDRISIGAATLNNLAETVNGVTSAGTIAARARLDIGAQAISNRDGSLIFSAGDLAIGGSLDADGRATGAAATLGNHASTIEATDNAGIGAAVLNNTNDGVTWILQPGTSEHRVEYAVPGSATHYPASEVLLAVGGNLPIVSIDNAGWSNWVATDASNPLAPGSNAAARLLLPSPDYPLERFRAYYLQSPANSADRSFRTCNVDTCETTAMPGAWYAISDPIWATFGVAPPPADLPATHPGRIDPHIAVGQEGLSATVDGPSGPTTVMLQRFDHPVTQAEYEQWQAYRAAHEALDVATLGFIHTITGVVRGPEGDKPPRLSSIYDAFDYTVTGSTAVLQSSAPGKILAGGAMNIDVGSGTNDMSQILAGGALTVAGGTIANVGLVVDAPTVQTGTAIHSYVQNDRRTYQFAPYDLTTYATITVAAARQEGNTSISGSGADAGSLTLGQTSATAQGAGSVQGTRVNPIVQVHAAVGGVGRV